MGPFTPRLSAPCPGVGLPILRAAPVSPASAALRPACTARRNQASWAAASSCLRKRGFTQAELAQTLGLAGSTWSRIEKGETSLSVEQLRAAAETLGIDPVTLLALAVQGEEALRAYGAIVASGADRAAPRPLGLGRAVESLLPAGALPLIGTALGAVLGKVLGSALEKALAADPQGPGPDVKEN